MQIVIDIPREQYSLIMQSHRSGVERFIDKEAMMYAIKSGTPLPKGHGRLIDVSEYFKKEFGDAREFLDKASTIIEANKAERSDKE